jgi:hypothetical protein
VLTAVFGGGQRQGADSPPSRAARAAEVEGGRGSGDSVVATLAEQRATLARIRGVGAGVGAPAVSRTAALIAGHLLGGRLCLARGKSAPAPPARPPARPPPVALRRVGCGRCRMREASEEWSAVLDLVEQKAGVMAEPGVPKMVREAHEMVDTLYRRARPPPRRSRRRRVAC